MDQTLENLYQILKKQIEQFTIEQLLRNPSLYTDEYDTQVVLFIRKATSEEEATQRLRDVRNIEREISYFLSMKLNSSILGSLKL
jgi:hypothetical protein